MSNKYSGRARPLGLPKICTAPPGKIPPRNNAPPPHTTLLYQHIARPEDPDRINANAIVLLRAHADPFYLTGSSADTNHIISAQLAIHPARPEAQLRIIHQRLGWNPELTTLAFPFDWTQTTFELKLHLDPQSPENLAYNLTLLS